MIAVVDYHKGNLKSVERGLIGVGADARITDDAAEIAAADAIVLPGVGAFADAAGSMRELGQMELVCERMRAGVPFLGICLGLHLLFESGEEHAVNEPTPGMGLLPGVVRALPATDEQGNAYKIPHVGWNSVEYCAGAAVSAGSRAAANPEPSANAAGPEPRTAANPGPLFAGIPEGEHFYFTHSFAAPACEATIATTTHSITFPCAVQLGERAFGVQFHPEKSSDAGAKLLRNFVTLACAR